ncbi:MAG TPA: heavy metal sensor histidine kinase [Chthoniobacterales bacterium]|jgi:two-component system heavy metal sensor histidine kinase CusS|nr:heavy metal sensor histidine kinase [Chthoniobacterales bacterium]
MTIRLVLFFTVAAAGLLLFAMAASFWIVIQHVDHDNDRYLTDKLAAIRADMAADSGPQSLNRELSIIRAADKAYTVRVLDATGNVVAESPKMRGVLPIEIFPKALSVPGQRPATQIYHARNHKTFALATAFADLGNQRLVLQLAQDRTHDQRFAVRYAGLLTVMLACAVVTCAGVAVLVTRRGLRPLKRLAESIERIGAMHLDERVPTRGWPDELQPLAIGFNKMLARLEDSFTRLSQFSADLAHELRTPIAILRGEAEGALTKPRSSEQYREVIESSLEEMQRLSAMIDNLLFLARAETIDSVNPDFLDGRAAIENVCEFYEALAQEQGVELKSEGKGQVYAKPVLFRRALINLITNALRFTPSGGRVTVSLRHRDGASEVAVADTGCGIPLQHVPNVFDRFFRGDAPRSAQGTGLGLSIVRSIMQMHDGSARLESNVGQGTVVTLTFPDRPSVSDPKVSSSV